MDLIKVQLQNPRRAHSVFGSLQKLKTKKQQKRQHVSGAAAMKTTCCCCSNTQNFICYRLSGFCSVLTERGPDLFPRDIKMYSALISQPCLEKSALKVSKTQKKSMFSSDGQEFSRPTSTSYREIKERRFFFH